ncbi:hypothetical protein ACFYPB_40365 [Streptomyces olivaceoviridis]|uniref:NHL domain-containing protein n=1 Tax=Streptomyces olivaceoviridis TaxID=1921 RepID=UPI00368D5405
MSGAARVAASVSEAGEMVAPVIVAGCGTAGGGGDGGAAVAAALAFPAGVAVEAGGGIVIADHANHRVRVVDRSGVISTVAGDGVRGFAGDGGPAVSARLGFPSSVAVVGDGTVFVADAMNRRVRRIGADGVIVTVAGDGTRGSGGDGGPALQAQFVSPCAVAAGGDGTLFVGDAGACTVRRIGADASVATVLSVAGATDGEAGVVAGPFVPAGLAVDAAGRVYVADPSGRRLVRRDQDGTVSLLAGPGAGEKAVGVDWQAPCAVAVDTDGTLYVADQTAHRVWRLASGQAHVFAGAGREAPSGPGGGQELAYPSGLAVDVGSRRLLVADNFHHRVVAFPLPALRRTSADDGERGTAPQPPPIVADLLVKQEGGLELRPGGR